MITSQSNIRRHSQIAHFPSFFTQTSAFGFSPKPVFFYSHHVSPDILVLIWIFLDNRTGKHDPHNFYSSRCSFPLLKKPGVMNATITITIGKATLLLFFFKGGAGRWKKIGSGNWDPWSFIRCL